MLRTSLIVLIVSIIGILSFYQVANADVPLQIKTIKIDTVPRVASVLVDDTLYLPSDIPLQFNWKVGSKHTIELSDTIVKNGVGSRYHFDTWTDQTTDPTQTVTVKNDISYKAIFKVQNYLKINSDFGKVKGEGWYDDGSIAQISILQNKIVDSNNLQQHIFDGWSDGNDKKSSKNSITVDHPLTINANWKDQYYLQLTSSVAGIEIPGSGWYDKGAQVPLVTDTGSKISNDAKYVFGKWLAKGDNLSIIDKPESNVAVLTINGPQTIEADWKKSYYVSVSSPNGDTSGSGFYDDGSTANISVSTTEVIIADKVHKVVFTGWSNAATQPNSANQGGTSNSQLSPDQSSAPKITVNVDKPMTFVANWKNQYYIDVTSKQGSASGSGWYDEGQPAKITVKQPSAPPGIWVRYMFDGWSGDYQGNSIVGSVIMDAPKTVSAEWRADYTPAIMNSIIISGVGAAGLVVYRKTKKKGADIIMPRKIVPPPTDGDEVTVANEIYRDKLRDEYEDMVVGKHQQVKEIQDKENFPPFIPALIKEYSDKILAYYYYKLYNDQRYGERRDWLLLIHQEIRERFEKTLKKDEERQRIVPK